MRKGNSIVESLLIDYFSGRLSQEDAAFIENWVARSDENKKLAEQIYYIISSADELKEINNIDAKSALQKVRNKISLPVRISPTLQRIAAIMAIPLFCTTLYFMLKPEMNTVQYVSMRANTGMVTSFNLPDNTKVWLNSGATLRYPEQFEGKTRQVELTGEAFFEVTKDKKHKFVVALRNGLSIEVLGTKFNLEAYEDDNRVRATLIEGEIQFSHSADGRKRSVILEPSQRLTYHFEDNSVEVGYVAVNPDIAWTYGKIVFENTSLEDALDILSQHFNVKFIIKENSLKGNSFTGQFSNEPLKEILEYFMVSSDIEHRYNNEDIIEIY